MPITTQPSQTMPLKQDNVRNISRWFRKNSIEYDPIETTPELLFRVTFKDV
jgi:hypothetical protein